MNLRSGKILGKNRGDRPEAWAWAEQAPAKIPKKIHLEERKSTEYFVTLPSIWERIKHFNPMQLFALYTLIESAPAEISNDEIEEILSRECIRN